MPKWYKYQYAIKLWTTAVLFVCVHTLIAQSIPEPNPGYDTTTIYIIHADDQHWYLESDHTIQTYNGNVILYQDSVFMYCDSAYIKDSLYLSAVGNISLVQGDSVKVFADTLYYTGDNKIAELHGEVVLENGDQKLYTNHLRYDVRNRIADYFTGATLTDDKTYLSSISGYYEVNEDLAYFKDSVKVIGESFFMRTDSMLYQTKDKTAYFLGPTLINQDDNLIYCESGYYKVEAEEAEFAENAQYRDSTKEASADIIWYKRQEYRVQLIGNAYFKEGDKEVTADEILYLEDKEWVIITGNGHFQDSTSDVKSDHIFYDAKLDSFALKSRSKIINEKQILEADHTLFSNQTGMGVAFGQVIWQDTAAGYAIHCDTMIYNNQNVYVKAMGLAKRPMLINELEEDSLFLRADTLEYVLMPGSDSLHQLLAYYDVRIYKSDLQGLCDSLVFKEGDSMFVMYDNPIMWADTSQFVADTMQIQLKNNQIDRIFLKENSFITNSPDQLFFNQIKGREITAVIENDELRNMYIVGNAETVYYVLDDTRAYIGVNKAICSRIRIRFGNNEVESIYMYQEPNSKIHPMRGTDHEKLKLEGFVWKENLRPKSKSDL